MTDRGPSIGDQLAAHLRAGTILDLIQRQPADTLLGEAEMQAWDDSHNIEADLIRDLLRGRTVSDPDPRGLRLRGGRICGQLDLDRLDTTIALELRDCLLENGITADWAHLPAVLLHRCRLSNPIGPALSGGRLRVETSVSLVGSVLRADSADGAVILSGAYIAGQLFCQGTKLCNSVGAALSADGLWTGGNVSLGGDFIADGAGASGAIRLPGAHIGGQLRCSGAILRNATGPALFADGLQVDRGLFFDEGFVAHGVDRRGAVRLIGARVGLRFDCQGATLSNPIGPALVADGIHVDEAVFFNRGFSADGADEGGTIRLLGAKIGGRLNCGGATLRNSSGPALAADGMQTDGNVLLHKRFTAEGVGKRGTVRLLGVHIGGRIDCRDSVIISNSNPLERWILDGLTYSGIPQIDSADRHREAWLELLRTATPIYTAQPYQQLATVYRSIGHDSDVRAILIAQRDHQLERRALTRRSDRWRARLSRILLGYGYQPWRALLYLAGLLTVSAILAVVLGAHGALARIPAQKLPPVHTAAEPVFADSEPCTLVQTIGKGLDLGTPFLPASQIGNGSCEITTNPTGEALTISRWVLQLAAWALAALFVVGFTGLVRKT